MSKLLDSSSPYYKTQVQALVDASTKLEQPRIMVGQYAFHQLGNISREDSDVLEYMTAVAETEDYWVGSWVEGYGFFNVVYPKSTTRELTTEERTHFKTLRFTIV